MKTPELGCDNFGKGEDSWTNGEGHGHGYGCGHYGSNGEGMILDGRGCGIAGTNGTGYGAGMGYPDEKQSQ